MNLRIITLIVIAVLTTSIAHAATYSLVNKEDLPIQSVNDPFSHKMRPITRYSFEELDTMLWNSPNFLRWNDGRKVCASMHLMFGRVSTRCAYLPTPKTYTPEQHTYVYPTAAAPRRATSKGTVSFNIVKPHSPRPKVSEPRIMHVMPIYPPYSSVYHPYR